jgi:hypothetical protein
MPRLPKAERQRRVRQFFMTIWKYIKNALFLELRKERRKNKPKKEVSDGD